MKCRKCDGRGYYYKEGSIPEWGRGLITLFTCGTAYFGDDKIACDECTGSGQVEQTTESNPWLYVSIGLNIFFVSALIILLIWVCVR
jgi:DnaJ-class molecular chaperone